MRLSEVLRSKPVRIVSLPPSASAVEAAALMKEEEVGAVLICDARRRIVGILSERDLAVAIAAYGPDLSRQRVSELMSVGGPTASPEDSVQDAMRTMTERRARHMPVIDGEAVVGVVSVGDLLKSRLVEKNQENAVLQDLARARLAA
jgi:CBS domain-containing protein